MNAGRALRESGERSILEALQVDDPDFTYDDFTAVVWVLEPVDGVDSDMMARLRVALPGVTVTTNTATGPGRLHGHGCYAGHGDAWAVTEHGGAVSDVLYEAWVAACSPLVTP